MKKAFAYAFSTKTYLEQPKDVRHHNGDRGGSSPNYSDNWLVVLDVRSPRILAHVLFGLSRSERFEDSKYTQLTYCSPSSLCPSTKALRTDGPAKDGRTDGRTHPLVRLIYIL